MGATSDVTAPNLTAFSAVAGSGDITLSATTTGNPTLSFTATDGNGACDGHAYYTVPKSQGQPWQVINSGLDYNSTVTVPRTRNK